MQIPKCVFLSICVLYCLRTLSTLMLLMFLKALGCKQDGVNCFARGALFIFKFSCLKSLVDVSAYAVLQSQANSIDVESQHACKSNVIYFGYVLKANSTHMFEFHYFVNLRLFCGSMCFWFVRIIIANPIRVRTWFVEAPRSSFPYPCSRVCFAVAKSKLYP